MGNNWKDIMLIMLVVAILVILMRMSKVMQMQSETLLGVASKLGIEPPKRQQNVEDVEAEDVEEEEEAEGEEEEEEQEAEEEDVESVDVEEVTESGKVIKLQPATQKVVTTKKVVKAEAEEPKKSRQEIFAMILDLFSDGIPRKRKAIEEDLGMQNLRPGYMSDVITTMRDKGTLGAEFIDKGDKWKSYYIFGLPDWYTNKKLKSEYAKKFNLTEKI